MVEAHQGQATTSYKNVIICDVIPQGQDGVRVRVGLALSGSRPTQVQVGTVPVY